MAAALDLTGQRFGKLTAIEKELTKRKGKARRWICKCDCGGETLAEVGNLRSGNSTSCGCLRAENASKVTPGMRFGRLQVLSRDGSKRYGKVSMSQWYCACDCGKFTSVIGMSLMNGDTKSCGCLLAESTAARASAQFLDLSGKEFGSLAVIDRATPPGRAKGNVRWLCACACGGLTILPGNSLVSGNTISCGCKAHIGQTLRSDTVRMKSRIFGAKRRAAEIQARKPFDDELFDLLEAEAYALSITRSSATGIAWNVHHIVPLKSKIVCGLHNEFNLAVIPATVNMSIGNRYWPQMPDADHHGTTLVTKSTTAPSIATARAVTRMASPWT